jgi:bifunctional hydroxylase/dehydrase
VSRTRPAATGSVLIRPDGYVAWVSPGGGDLGLSLHRWFGRPQPVPVARPAGPLAANW